MFLEKDKTFSSLKQHPATHLFYLLLTPVNVYTTKINSYGVAEQSNTYPVGLIIGPGLAAGNMIAAGSANKKFKDELNYHNLHGKTIKAGETTYGLIGIRADNYDAIKIRVDIPAQEVKKHLITP